MKKGLILLFFLLLLTTSSIKTFAQLPADSTKLWRVETTNGNEFIGTVVDENSQTILLSTRSFGILTIQKKDISHKTMLSTEKVVGGQVWVENPQSARYFWAPNGYGLKKGEGYYQNVWVLFNQASYGFSDYFSVGVGMLPLFLFGGTPTPVWITPKVSVPVVKGKLNLGGGILAGTVIGESDVGFGIAYGVATFGSKNINITGGFGYGYADGGWADKPLITIGAMVRMSRRGYFVTENYYISTGPGSSISLISFGGRTVWKKLSLDYGLIIPVNEDIDSFIALPWLGFVIPFGK